MSSSPRACVPADAACGGGGETRTPHADCHRVSHPDYADVAAICDAATPKAPRPKPVASEQVVTGVVYLIRMGEFHKIGKSNDPGRRNYELSLRLPEKHDVLHVIDTDDPSGSEAYWHRRLASQRANGEWFRLAPENVVAYMRRYM